MVLVRVFIASFYPGKKGNNGQSIQVRSFINPLDDDINWLLQLRDKSGQRLRLIVAGSEARDCHRSTKLRNITGERGRGMENVAMNETEPGVSIRPRGGLDPDH